jgi:acyl carrier protein
MAGYHLHDTRYGNRIRMDDGWDGWGQSNFLTPGEGFIAPRNAIEKQLALIWFELLSPTDTARDSIGIDDDFFHLGGHSLKAAILISKIGKEMKVDVPLVEVFRKPTIRQLAEYIEKNMKKSLIMTGDDSLFRI